jgi:hypothetical protein
VYESVCDKSRAVIRNEGFRRNTKKERNVCLRKGAFECNSVVDSKSITGSRNMPPHDEGSPSLVGLEAEMPYLPEEKLGLKN